MQVVSLAEMETPKKRAPRARAEPAPEPVVVQEPVSRIPMPPTAGFAEDQKFRGITAAMDKVLDSLHRDGWSLQRLYEQPLATLPLPAGKFPPGRVYMMTENVAVVVNRTTGSVVTSLPVTAALKTLNQFTPEVLDEDPWAAARWSEFLGEASPDDIDISPRWTKQSFFDRNGSIWTVRRVHDGAKIAVNGETAHLVRDDVEAEDLGLHPVLVELVAYVLEIDPQ